MSLGVKIAENSFPSRLVHLLAKASVQPGNFFLYGTMAHGQALTDFARRHGLTVVSVDELANYRRSMEPDGADRLAKDDA